MGSAGWMPECAGGAGLGYDAVYTVDMARLKPSWRWRLFAQHVLSHSYGSTQREKGGGVALSGFDSKRTSTTCDISFRKEKLYRLFCSAVH